ncbi:hypothetical protein HYY69_04125 [Candidatus Woesearchaeota archaeon]|nr:hypothetical protein [Candidatus Woesearchaeota archaeon]
MELENLKKKFIIDKSKYEEERLPLLIQKALTYCKVDSDGNVYLEKQNIPLRDKIILSLIGRFLASKLDPTIKPELTGDEIATMLCEDKPVVFARLKDILDLKIISRLEKGTYLVMPLHIEKILSELDSKYNSDLGYLNQHKKMEGVKEPITSEIKKTMTSVPKIDNNDLFVKQLLTVDKSNYTHIYELPTITLKTLGILDLFSKELKLEWVSSPHIINALNEIFRIKISWPNVSMSLRQLDEKALVQSHRKEGHGTAREYRIMKKGEDELKIAIQRIQEKKI